MIKQGAFSFYESSYFYKVLLLKQRPLVSLGRQTKGVKEVSEKDRSECLKWAYSVFL